ncbi:FtsH protease activity modulator HflK [Pseudoroseicyclus aestuarii]|nr:FtsH protease activity modulator HflK [Pseudoroseicyclus aestuarii]
MAGNSQGPWGGGGRGTGGSNGTGGDSGGNGGYDGGRRPQQPPRRPGESQQIDDLMNRGREQLRVLMGGRSTNGGGGGNGGSSGPEFRIIAIGGLIVLLVLWAFLSFYTVRPEEQSVELFLGEYSSTGESGLNFAPWPLVTHQVIDVTSERTESIGNTGNRQGTDGLMLTTDANIVDIGFQVVWNISDPAQYIFNIRDPETTVQAVAESVMREIIAASNLAPILNRDRGLIADTAQEQIQETLNDYGSGINILRVNLEAADPPAEVIDAFRDVQAAEQERDRVQRLADAYANRVLAEARGEAAQIVEGAEAYRAQTVNDALGEASRFSSVQEEYQLAPEVTRRRIYLETMEDVLGGIDKIVLDSAIASGGQNGGTGIVPFLPLNDLARSGSGGAAASTQTGGGN